MKKVKVEFRALDANVSSIDVPLDKSCFVGGAVTDKKSYDAAGNNAHEDEREMTRLRGKVTW